MYIVVSRWEVVPGKEQEFEIRGKTVREMIRSQPGVKMVEGFRTDEGGVVAIIGYESRAAYDNVVTAADSPFNRAVAEHKLEECGRWVGSDRGESIQD